MSYANLIAGNIVNFTAKAEVIRTQYVGVEVLGVVTPSIAMTVEDVKSMHLQIKPYIPGLPKTYADYKYVLIQYPNGQRAALGLPWINESSITISNQSTYQLILDNLEPEQVEIIRRTLVNRGISIRTFELYSG